MDDQNAVSRQLTLLLCALLVLGRVATGIKAAAAIIDAAVAAQSGGAPPALSPLSPLTTVFGDAYALARADSSLELAAAAGKDA